MANAITGPVTEIVYIPLKSSFDYNNADDKAVVDATVEKVATLGGVKGLFWGFQIENPLTLQMVVDWENLDGHKAFMDSPDYQPFLDHLGTITSDVQAVPFHIRAPIGEGGVDPRDAPVTECVGGYFDPATDQEKWTNENWKPFKAQSEKIPDTGLHGLLGGWSIEGHKHENLGEGVEGKLHAAFLGWPSVEAHMKFREREEFKQVIPLFRSGVTAFKVHHVALKRRI